MSSPVCRHNYKLFAVGGSLQNLFGGSFLWPHVSRRGRGLRVTGVHHAVQVARHLPQVCEPRMPEIVI
jgi:hypothetical protein